MNDPERAVLWLKYAAENGFPCYPLFALDRSLEAVRQDPRFVEFMAKTKRQWEHQKAVL